MCLVAHEKLGRLLQPGGHIEAADASLEAAALREAREETALELELHPDGAEAVRPRHPRIPERPGEPAHWHLDVRYLVVGRGEPCDGAAWHPLGAAGDVSVDAPARRCSAQKPGVRLERRAGSTGAPRPARDVVARGATSFGASAWKIDASTWIWSRPGPSSNCPPPYRAIPLRAQAS